MNKKNNDLPCRALVTGSSGLIGSALCDRLRAHGCELVELSHRAREGALEWSPEKGYLPDAALEGVDAVFHLAGENIGSRWTLAKKRLILKSRVEGTELLAQKMAALPHGKRPAVFISASAIGYYGVNRNAAVDESSDRGKSFLSDVCKQWEDAAALASGAGIRVVHPRMSAVLSPKGGALEKLLPLFRKGGGGVVGGGEQRMSWISLPDAVSALLHCATCVELRGPVNLVAPEVVTNREFTRTLAEVLNRPALLPAPAFAVRLLLGEMAKETVLNDLAVVPARLRQCGFTFQHEDLDLALRSILD